MEAHAAVTVLDRFVVIIGKLLYYFSCRTMTVNYRLSVNYDKKQSKLMTMKENDDNDDDDDKKKTMMMIKKKKKKMTMMM